MNTIYDPTLRNAMATHNADRWRGIHRKTVRPHRRLSVVLSAVLAVGALTPLTQGESNPPAVASPSQAFSVPTEILDRTTTTRVSRSKRVAVSRTTRITRAITFAKAQQGDRYRWGAEGPSKWDCSGLVMKSFAKAGVKLPRTTRTIINKGKRVSKKNMRRGDIIFPQRGHVGIYLGNGKMVHASSGRGRVVVSKVYGFYTARRVL
jgi:cell wall-associated NlpC family hydrolase